MENFDRRRRVGKRHTIELDRSIDFHFPSFFFAEARLILHHFEHFLAGLGTVDDISVAIGDTRGCAGQTIAVHDESSEKSRGEFAIVVDGEVAAVPENDQGSDGRQEWARGDLDTLIHDSLPVDVVHLLVQLPILLNLGVLGAEGLHHLHSAELLPDVRCHFRNHILFLPDQHLRSLGILEDDEHIDRDDDEHAQGESPTHREEDEDAAHQGEDVADHIGKIVADGRLGLVDVTTESADELTGFMLLEKKQIIFYENLVNVGPHVDGQLLLQ